MACSNIRDNTTIREKACNANGKRSLIDSPPFSCGSILTQFSHALSPFRSLWWSVRYSYLPSTTIVVIYALSFWPTQLHTCTTGQTNIHRGSCFGSWSCLDPSGTTAIYEYSCAGEMVSTCVIPTFFLFRPTHSHTCKHNSMSNDTRHAAMLPTTPPFLAEAVGVTGRVPKQAVTLWSKSPVVWITTLARILKEAPLILAAIRVLECMVRHGLTPSNRDVHNDTYLRYFLQTKQRVAFSLTTPKLQIMHAIVRQHAKHQQMWCGLAIFHVTANKGANLASSFIIFFCTPNLFPLDIFSCSKVYGDTVIGYNSCNEKKSCYHTEYTTLIYSGSCNSVG